jgi:transposase
MRAVGVDVDKANLDVAVYGEVKVQRFANTAAGVRRLLQRLQGLEEVRIVLEATGGYEEPVLAACSEAGLWIARIHPRQARDFARATGQLAKTDALDVRMLAEMAQVFPARLRRHIRLESWQCELRGWLRRRHQVTEAIQRTRQQLAMTLPTIRPLVRKTLAALVREQSVIDTA